MVTSADDGMPIIGASVLVDGTTVGTVTDFDGKYTIDNLPSGAKTVTVSYIGYKAQTLAIKAVLNVVLKSDTEQLDEVVVVAFGKAKKSQLTGSVASVGEKEISMKQISNATQALVGKTPGITVSSSNNQPGTSASVSVRGIGSFNASSAPLYVVDGVPYDGDISAINPQDIKSMSVLKDAASAALYGARGANGVIMITTKNGKGSSEKISVTVEARYGFNQIGIPDYNKLSDARAYAAKYYEGIFYNAYMNPNVAQLPADKRLSFATNYADGIYFATGTAAQKNANLGYPFLTFPEGTAPFVRGADGHFSVADGTTVGGWYTDTDGQKYWVQPDDWRKEAFKTNPRQEYNMSLSGHSEKANYYASIGYLSDEGYVEGSSFDRITSRLRGDYTVNKYLKLGGNISFTHYKSNMLTSTREGGDTSNIFGVVSGIAPIYPMYLRNEDKEILYDKWGNKVYDFGNNTMPGLKRPYMPISNPLALNGLDKHDHVANIISARGYMDFNILEGLTATINVGFDSDDTYHTNVSNPYYGQYAGQGLVNKTFTRQYSLNTQQLVNYIKSFGDHNFTFLLGHEYYMRKGNRLWGQKQGLYWPDAEEINGAILDPRTESSLSEYGTEGYLGRVQYDYNNKYFAQFSFRRDASSNFHKDNRWGNFWSAGLSWLAHREDFMKNFLDSAKMSTLKFKLSYGVQGNDAVGGFNYCDLYTLKNSNDQYAVTFAQKGNKDLTWETSKNLNFGIETGFWKNRLVVELDLYSREVTDMLFWRKVPRSAGYSGYYDNIGSMRNNGVDFTVTGQIIKSDDFNWTMSVNGGYFKNELTKLPEEWEAMEGGYRDGSSIYRVGGSIYDITIPKYLGVNDNGQATWQTLIRYDDNGNPLKDAEGEFIYEKGSTTVYSVASEKENRELRTDIAPKLQGGINSSMTFKGFDLSVSMSYALGGYMYDGSYASYMHSGRGDQAGNAWHKDIQNSWTPEFTDTDVPMVNYNAKDQNAFSDRFLVKRDHLALNNITLGYTLPQNISNKLMIQNARFYMVGDNLGLLSARKGFDPRFGGGVGYKAMRTFSAGMRLTF